MSPKFTKTSVRKNESLGEKLSKKRASLGYEIKDVERAIKIRSKHIEYLESSDWKSLPPDVYVRGFLKSYAELLKLNPEKVISLYLKEKGLIENVSMARKRSESKKQKRKSPKIIITPKKLTIATIIVTGLLIFSYIGWQLTILAAPPKLLIASPEDNLKTASNRVVIEGQTDAGAKVFINNFEIGVLPDGTFKEEVDLQKGLNLIQIKAVSRLERETETRRTVVFELTEKATEESASPTEVSPEN